MFSKDNQLNFVLTILIVCGLLLLTYFMSMYSINWSFFLPKSGNTESFDYQIKVKSSAFENGGQIPEKYTCKGENVNPPLEISNVPAGTASLVITLEDKDSVVKPFDHWIVFNANSKTSSLAENTLPAGGITGQNSYGKGGYQGPCPPSGSHRYIFTVYAVDKILSAQEGASKSIIFNEMNGNVIDVGILTGTFGN